MTKDYYKTIIAVQNALRSASTIAQLLPDRAFPADYWQRLLARQLTDSGVPLRLTLAEVIELLIYALATTVTATDTEISHQSSVISHQKTDY